MRLLRTSARIVIGVSAVWAVAAAAPAGRAPGPQTTTTAPRVTASTAAQSATDQYARYELGAPDTATFHVSYEVSATTAGATRYVDPVRPGTTVTQASATDLMTGQPLTVTPSGTALVVTLLRPVPQRGQGRIRIDKTVKTVKGAAGYTLTQGLG
ncbi:MAG TPA: hypothetical protein VIX35_06055, partial [Vicinamibacterales bacterium]